MQAALPVTHIELPGQETPVRIHFDRERKLSGKEYVAFCRADPDLRVERTASGEIVIVPPAGTESAYRSMKVGAELDRWATKEGRGQAIDSSAQFKLADGWALSPDAAWVSNESLNRFTPQQRKEFLPLCPEFVIEVMSACDRLKRAKAKMELWIANGAERAWLIDGDERTIYVYRKGQPVQLRRGLSRLSGEGPVKGFVLQLRSIWEGLG